MDGAYSALRLIPVELADERVRPADDAATASLSNTMASRCEPFGTELVRDGDELVLALGSLPGSQPHPVDEDAE